MALAFRSKSYFSGTNNSGSASVSEPAGAAQGDLLIGFFQCGSSPGVPTKPTGWTSLTSGSSNTPNFRYSIAYIIRGSTAPSYTWTFTAVSTYQELHVLCFSGANSAPIDVTAYLTSTTTTSNPNPPSVTTTAANDLVLAFGYCWVGSSAGWTAPTGYVLRSDNTAGNDICVASKAVATAGAEDPGAFSGMSTGSTHDVWGGTIAIKCSFNQTVNPTAIATTEAVNPSPVSAKINVVPTGSPTAESVQVAVLALKNALSLAAIVSAEVVNTVSLAMRLTQLPLPVPTAEVVQAVTINTGQHILPTGAPTAEAVQALANVILGLPHLLMAGAPSAEMFGVPFLNVFQTVSPSGAPSSETFSAVELTIISIINVSPADFAEEIVSALTIASSHTSSLLGIPSEEEVFAPFVIGPQYATMASIASAEVVSAVSLQVLIRLGLSTLDDTSGFGTFVIAFPFAPLYVNARLPDFVLRLKNRDGSLAAELSNAVVTEVEWELNKEGKLDFTLAKNDPVNSVIRCGLHEAQLWWKGQPLWTGPVWQAKRKPSGIDYGCQGLLSYFKKRPILRASLLYTSIEQTAIANLLVQAAQSGEANTDLHIGTAASVGGSAHIRSRQYDRNKHELFYDLLQEFPTLRDGFDFDIVVDPSGRTKNFTAFYPSKGSQLSEIGLEWQRNIADYEVDEDAFVMANEVYATGGSNAGVKFENNYEDTTAAATYGVMAKVVSDGQQNDVNWLLDLAHRWVELLKVPQVTTQITAVEVPQALLGVIDTGDSVRVLIDDFDTQVSGYQRIQKIKWTPNDGKLVYSFVPPVVLG